MFLFIPGILVVAIIILVVSFKLCNNEKIYAFLFGLIFVALIVLMFSPFWNPSGLPIEGHFMLGTYRVKIVHVTPEDNVDLLLEWPNVDNAQTFYYRFNKRVFEGEINPDAKNLIVEKVVLQTGSYLKLRLE